MRRTSFLAAHHTRSIGLPLSPSPAPNVWDEAQASDRFWKLRELFVQWVSYVSEQLPRWGEHDLANRYRDLEELIRDFQLELHRPIPFARAFQKYLQLLNRWIKSHRDLMDVIDVALAAGSSASETPKSRTARIPMTIDARIRSALVDDRSRFAWTLRQWAEVLQCSESSVCQTRAWKEIQSAREVSRLERGEKRHTQ